MITDLSQEEAVKEAEYELRFNVGTLPYLSDPVVLHETYYFLIKYTPVTIRPTFTEKEILFYPSQTIGVLWFDENNDVQRTDTEALEENIRQAREQVDAGKLKPLCYDELVEKGVAEDQFSQ